LYGLRGVFGIVGEAAFTILTLLISRFGGKYYDSLMGVGLCMPYFFDSLSNVMTPLIYDIKQNMDLTWGMGCIVCLGSFLAALIISITIKKDLIKEETLKINN
jgi:hypothetical protein